MFYIFMSTNCSKVRYCDCWISASCIVCSFVRMLSWCSVNISITWNQKVGNQVNIIKKNTLEAKLSTQTFWTLNRVIALVISKLLLNNGPSSLKLGHQVRSLENLVNTPQVICSTQKIVQNVNLVDSKAVLEYGSRWVQS